MDYVTAIENAARFVRDPVLRKGYFRRGKDGRPLFYSGSFSQVFIVDCGSRTSYALRCWTRDIGEIARRYDEVSKYLAQARLPYFVDFAYLADGILVNGVIYPILRMEWVEAPSLRDFICENRYQPQVLRAAAESFLTMAQTLHQRQIAHGDLQSDSVRVRMSEAGPEVALIDYDTLFVPSLAGIELANGGIPAFQHPKRAQVKAAIVEADYFAELVIYLTLHAVAEDPRLWEEYIANHEKELIFKGSDFCSKTPTECFRRLRQLSPFVGKLTLALWNYCCNDIQQLIPIEEAVRICRNMTCQRIVVAQRLAK